LRSKPRRAIRHTLYKNSTTLVYPGQTTHERARKHGPRHTCRSVYDPEIPVNIYDLGLIYTIELDDKGHAEVTMSLTAPGCPVAGEMPGWIADAIAPLPGINTVNVELVWEPQWGMDMMSDAARLELGFM